MQNVYEMKFDDFIEIAASKSHTPGGGNVSASVATLGASMVAMVGNLTLSNKNYADHHEAAKTLVVKVMDIIARLKKLTMDDMKAFDDYMGVFKMPKGTDEEKKGPRRGYAGCGQKGHSGTPGYLQGLPGDSG